MYDIGLNLGIAFQIQDDYLDLFGDEKIIGKKLVGCGQQQKTALHHLFVNTIETQLSKYHDYININNDDEKLKKSSLCY